MASAVQLSFSIRTSTNVKTVHLVGSWDGYKNQLPLSKDAASSKAGSWKGTFRFQGATLKLGQRYWYYYILDGFHVCHDPAKDSTTEPTTGRELNILDVPGGKSSTASADKRSSQNVAHGRALSPGKIQHPRPAKPYASRQIREVDYSRSPPSDDEDLVKRLEQTRLTDYRDRTDSPPSAIAPSPASPACGSAESSSPSELSSLSDHSRSRSCVCERYGVTRRGDRVKIDCGGARCGYGSQGESSSSGCSSEDSESEEDVKRRAALARAGHRNSRAMATSGRSRR